MFSAGSFTFSKQYPHLTYASDAMDKLASNDGSNVTLNIRPGLVSAFYFILFDLILITIIDLVLSRIMSYYYYNAVYNGRQVPLKSADIPGITTFLIGDFRNFANIAALTTKLLVLAAVFTVDLSLNSAEAIRTINVHLTTCVRLELSDTFWVSPDGYSVAGTDRASLDCRVFDDNGFGITYHALALNTTANTTVDGSHRSPNNISERDRYSVDYNSIQCLAPGKVAEKNVIQIARVIGCSEVMSTDCTISEPVNFDLRTRRSVRLDANISSAYTKNSTYTISISDSLELKGEWRNYKNAELLCMTTKVGRAKDNFLDICKCLITANYTLKNGKDGTLVELWVLDTNRIRRKSMNILKENINHFRRIFPGPVFEGNLQIGTTQKIELLRRLWFCEQQSNWATISGVLVGNAGAYTSKDMDITVMKEKFQQSEIPLFAVIIIGTLVFVTLLLVIFVSFRYGMKDRPALNNISGLAFVTQNRNSSSLTFLKSDNVLVALSEEELGRRFYPLSPRHEKSSDSSSTDAAPSTVDVFFTPT